MKEERRLSQKQAKEGKKAGKMISLRSGMKDWSGIGGFSLAGWHCVWFFLVCLVCYIVCV